MTDLTQYDPETDEIVYNPKELHPYKTRKKTWEQIQYETELTEEKFRETRAYTCQNERQSDVKN